MLLTRRSFVALAAIRFPKPVRVGVWGMIGHTEEAVAALPSLPDVQVTALADPDARRLAGFAKRFPAAKTYAEGKEMLAKEDLDVVVLANSNGERAAGILECARRKRHVFAEKPLATNLTDLEAVRTAVAASGIGLGCMLKMRTDPWFQKMREMVQAGAIGEIGQIETQKSYQTDTWPEWKSKRSSYGGTIPWIGVDLIDLMLHTSGRQFRSVVSMDAHIGFPELGEAENSTGSLFRMDNGGVAVMRLDYFRPKGSPTHGDDRLRLAGTKGVLEYQMSTGVTYLEQGAKPRVISELPPKTWLFTDFLAGLYAGGKDAIPHEEIYRSSYVTLKAFESARSGSIVPLA